MLQWSLSQLLYEPKSVPFVVSVVFYQKSRDVANTCDDSKPICISIGSGSLYQSRFRSLFTLDESDMSAEPTAANTLLVFLLIRFMLLRLCGPKAIVVHPSRNNEKIKQGIIYHFLMLSPYASARLYEAISHFTEQSGGSSSGKAANIRYVPEILTLPSHRRRHLWAIKQRRPLRNPKYCFGLHRGLFNTLRTVTQICVFTLQLCKTDDANLRF